MHNNTIINRRTQEDFFNNICTSHFIARVRKGYSIVCVWEEAGDRTELKYFDPHSYGRQRCVFLVLLMLNLGSTLLGDGFLYCILSASSLDHNSSGPQAPFGLMWLSLPHLVYNSHSDWNCNSTVLTSVLTKFTPTRSLKSQVWSSSSGNNCHAVHRSLSSGASVYKCTMGIFLPRPISSANFRPRDFLS